MSPVLNDPALVASVEAAIDGWIEALRRRDLDALMRLTAQDVVLFDAKPPHQIVGTSAVRQGWEECLPFFPESFGYERRDSRIRACGDLAVAHWIFRLTGWPEGHPASAMWLRATVALERRDGHWVSVHEHVSAPVDCETGLAVYS